MIIIWTSKKKFFIKRNQYFILAMINKINRIRKISLNLFNNNPQLLSINSSEIIQYKDHGYVHLLSNRSELSHYLIKAILFSGHCPFNPNLPSVLICSPPHISLSPGHSRRGRSRHNACSQCRLHPSSPV